MNIEKIFNTSEFETLGIKWGLRGDPYLWDELKKSVISHSEFSSEDEFIEFIEQKFNELTKKGKISDDRTKVFIDSFQSEGMSGGLVSLTAWKERLLPLLSERFKN